MTRASASCTPRLSGLYDIGLPLEIKTLIPRGYVPGHFHEWNATSGQLTRSRTLFIRSRNELNEPGSRSTPTTTTPRLHAITHHVVIAPRPASPRQPRQPAGLAFYNFRLAPSTSFLPSSSSRKESAKKRKWKYSWPRSLSNRPVVSSHRACISKVDLQKG